jgi:NADH:ubiquinone oxidoreductase subunit K
MNIGPGHYAVLSALVFAIGGFGAVARRQGVAVLLAVAVMLIGPVIALVGFSEFGSGGQTAPAGSAFAAVAVASLVAEAAVAVAILSLVRRRRDGTDVDGPDDLVA